MKKWRSYCWPISSPGEEQIAGLAKDRALTVRNTLEELNPELKPRLFLKSGDIYQKPETGPGQQG